MIQDTLGKGGGLEEASGNILVQGEKEEEEECSRLESTLGNIFLDIPRDMLVVGGDGAEEAVEEGVKECSS